MAEQVPAGARKGPTSPLGWLHGGLRRVEHGLSYVGMAVCVALMLMVVAEVILRSIFKNPISGYLDSMEMMMAVLVFLGVAYCQDKGSHIRTEVIVDKLKKSGGAKYYVTESFHLIIALAGFVLIAVYASLNMVNAYTAHDTTAGALIPTWPARAGVVLGSILLCLRLLVQLIQNISLAARQRAIIAEAGAPEVPTGEGI